MHEYLPFPFRPIRHHAARVRAQPSGRPAADASLKRPEPGHQLGHPFLHLWRVSVMADKAV